MIPDLASLAGDLSPAEAAAFVHAAETLDRGPVGFDRARFADLLDAVRASRSLTWRAVSREADVPASTLTRIQQGRAPDVDSLARLCHWSGLTDMTRWIREGVAE